ncbi:MAG: asparagine synthase-related protein [Steroidobacteraceae bacterium]
MEFPFVAALWNPLDSAQAIAAARLLATYSPSNLSVAIDRPGLAAYTGTPSAPYLDCFSLPNNAGLLLGVLFDRRTNHRVTQTALNSQGTLGAPGLRTIESFTRKHWGTFVGFLSDPLTGDWYATRDCSGMIACYYTMIDGITILTSDARYIFTASNWSRHSGPPRSVNLNWEYLELFLTHSQMQIRETAMRDVYELLAGEVLYNVNRKLSVKMAWSPDVFAHTDDRLSIDAYSARLHETVHSCVNAWASVHRWVLHNLSGGFDSSLVLALLAQTNARPHSVSINRFAYGPAEDERQYARLAAESAGIPLVEWPWDFSSHTLSASSCCYPFGAKPTLQNLLEPIDERFISALKSTHRFDAIWTGEGGDHLFLSAQTPLIVTDSIRTHGGRKQLRSTLYSAARITGRSIPGLLAHTLLQMCRFSAELRTASAIQNPFVPTPISTSMSTRISPTHPWMSCCHDVAPGKQLQISLLAEVIHRRRPLSGTQGSYALAPLLSQPLIELCLETPTFVLQCDGRTRGLARRTFSKELPPEITRREVKGQTAHAIIGLLNRSRGFLRETLLDGALVGRGLLNPEILASALMDDKPISVNALFPLSAAVAAETWVRSWL